MMGTAPRRFKGACITPFPDESLLGLVTRALSHTAIRQLKRGLHVAGASRPAATAAATTLTDPTQITSLAYAFGWDPSEIQSRVYESGTFEHSGTETLTFFGTQIRALYRGAKIRRVSPRALDLSPYHRAVWELKPFAFDPATCERLLDTCPVCKWRLGWHRAHGPTMCDRCVDGRGIGNVDLRDFPQPVFEVNDAEALRFVTDLVNPIKERKLAARCLLPSSWSNVSNSSIFETMMALVSSLATDPYGVNNVRGRARSDKDFEKITPQMFAMAGRAIIGGESGFAALADQFRRDMDQRPRFYGRRKELGGLAYLTYDTHIDPESRELLRASVITNMKQTAHAHALRMGEDADKASLSIEAFAAKFGVRRSVLSKLSQSGLVDVIRSKEARRSPVRMSIAEVAPLLEQMKDAIGQSEAAGLLGLPVHALRSLADRSVLHRLEGAVLGLIPGNAGYTRSSVDKLLTDLGRRLREKAPVKTMPLILAARSLGPGPAPWTAIILAILAGEIEIFADPGNRKSIRYAFAVTDIPAFVAAVRRHILSTEDQDHPEWIGNATAAEMLKTTEVFVWRLSKLRPDLLESPGDKFAPFRWDNIAEIAERYIFVPEIAAAASLAPRLTASWLKANGLSPVFSLREKKDLAFLRSEVEPLLAASRATKKSKRFTPKRGKRGKRT